MNIRSIAMPSAAAVAALLTMACGGPAKVPATPVNAPATAGQAGQPQFGQADPNLVGANMNAQAAGLYTQGMRAWQAGELRTAAQFFGQAVEADPEAAQAHFTLGVVQERLGSSAAGKSYQRAFQIIPKYERALVAYALFLGKRGDLNKAESFLIRKRAKFAKSASLAAALAEVKSLQKDSASAQRFAQEALKLEPSHAPAMMAIARDHYRGRRLDLALYALQAVLDGFGPDNPPRDNKNAEGYLLRAFIMAERDERIEAMKGFRAALVLRPDLVVARLKLATYLLESGAADEALAMLQRAIKYDDKNIGARLSLGDAYRLTGKYAEAKQQFDIVKRSDANLPAVHYNLGLLYLFAPKTSIAGLSEKSQVKAAIASLSKFKKLQGKNDKSDADELLSRAKLKLAEIEAIEKANQPQPVKPPPAAGKGS